MYLYLILNIVSISIPFAYSFHKKMNFIKYWKAIFSSILLVGLAFILWDAIFTLDGVWGFNTKYHLPYKLLGLPLEEWLFFICIPYASVFIHYAFDYYFPTIKLSKRVTQIISVLIIIILSITILNNLEKVYTSVNFSIAVILLIIGYLRIKKLQKFYISFLIILIPFFIVNGILTGSFIEEPIVWYNNNENLGIRLFTIPIEDTVYAFNLLFINVVLIDEFKSILKKE
ncbi:lycopene cyclase domain-containing protein [Maribacter vaceletii]|uniref:Lycopene cyclase domain-containing protein n=1 Tax=Maribacter vaceletii TaxID=1206816 RepID=A0A495EDL0_9FLAO|nr:lycopene cyclase domain-containing protein [Maribacter vaceletii]RKR14709.1 lycopene cyclase domain-containing protein [Maribacter vaceletii]